MIVPADVSDGAVWYSDPVYWCQPSGGTVRLMTLAPDLKPVNSGSTPGHEWRRLEWVEITGPFDVRDTAPCRIGGGDRSGTTRITLALWQALLHGHSYGVLRQ